MREEVLVLIVQHTIQQGHHTPSHTNKMALLLEVVEQPVVPHLTLEPEARELMTSNVYTLQLQIR